MPEKGTESEPSRKPASGEASDARTPVAGQRTGRSRAALSDRRALSGMQTTRTPEYLVIGHICADLQADGSYVLGGTALYSALTAARLGMRVGVLTRGVYGRTIGSMTIPSLDDFASEISIIVQDADTPTVFVNEYTAGRRVQTMPKWAGPIDLRGLPPHWRNARILHMGPISQEIDPKQTGGLTPEFFGVTPQGWMRDWPRATGGRVTLHALRLPGELMSRIDAMVVSDEEITLARDAVEQVGRRRLGVITMGEYGARILFGGERVDLPGYKVPTVDLTGAGDTFAAAFFNRAADKAASAVSAGKFANAVAALSLRGVGASMIPTKREADEFLATAEEIPHRR